MFCRMLRIAFVIALICLWLGVAPSAHAATLTVTNLGDNGSPGQLRTLINTAAPGDTILIPAGTIILAGPSGEDGNLSGDLDILKDLTIQGAGAGATMIDGGALDGVFDILANHTLILSRVTIQNGRNSSQAGGGGIRNFGTLRLADVIVRNNQAALTTAGDRNLGGGIRNIGVMSLNNVTITGNIARGNGGGIYNVAGGVMTLTDVLISDNSADLSGGGIYNDSATANLTNVTLSGNNADSNGGGIFTGGVVVSAATAALTNVTVSGNRANGSGGGIYNSATASLTNVTVAGNTANFSGGGLANFGSATLKNAILSGNTDVALAGTSNCSGAVTSLGHNLDGGAGCRFAGLGDLSNIDPLLAPLQNNGGLTPTHALLPGSPAVDAGTNDGCPASDQRGVKRSAVCDIGAYEAVAGPAGITLSIIPANTTASVQAGQAAHYDLSLSSASGQSGPVTLACSGAPTGAACTVNPASTQVGASPAQLAVTVATTARSPLAGMQSALPPAPQAPRLFYGIVLSLALGSFFVARQIVAGRPGLVAVLGLGVVLMCLLTGCAGNGSGSVAPPSQSGTPAGSYTIVVTATSGSVSQAVQLSLTVN